MRYWVSLLTVRIKPPFDIRRSRPPIPPHVYMKSYTEHAVSLSRTFKSTFRRAQRVTGPPKLPQELERKIFETCARECPDVCTVLVLVAKRVHAWSACTMIIK
jgi:hypothetical protein